MPALTRTRSASSVSSLSSLSPSPSPPPELAAAPSSISEVEPPPPREPTPPPLPTTFKGRLGYACLNTVLRAQKPSIFCSRTCRLATLEENGVEHAYALGLENTKNLIPMIEWNEAHDIKFMRLSSEMFPFASHGVWGYKIKDVPGAAEELKKAGDRAKELGHRLTMHPGQWSQIGSKNENTVNNAIKDLEYHCEILELMGLDQDSVMIIHGGGVYGDRETTVLRFLENWKKVPKNVQDRLVLENDEMCWSVEQLLPICEQLRIPLVLDWHHDAINPSTHPPTHYIPRITALFQSRNIKPKQHYSESRKGAETPMERRAHSDRVVALPPCDDDMDLMIEAKDKEMAVLDLYKRYGLSDKWRGVLTVPGEEGMRTKGRKRRKVVEEVEEVEEGGEEGDGKKRKARKKRGRKVVVVEEEEIVEPKGDECEECEHAVEEEDGSDFEPVGKEKLKAKGKGKGKPKAAAKPEPNGKVKVEETVVAVTTPKRKSRKVILSQTSEEPLPDEGDVLDAEIEAAGGRRKRRKVKIEVDDVEGEVGEDSVIPAPASTPAKKKRAKKVTSSGGESAGQDGSTADPVTNPAPKRVRKPKTIPPVDLPLELPSPREASPPAVTTPTSSSPPQKRARKQSEPQTIPFKRTKSSSTVNGTPPLTRRASKAASLGLSSEGLGGVVDQALKGVRIEG